MAMITKVSAYYESLKAVQTNCNSIKNESTRVVNETVTDSVQLSTEGIRKAESGSEHFQKAKALFASQAYIDPEQQENIAKLITDLKALKEKSEITEAQRENLKDDLKSTLQGVQKPSETAVEKLAADFFEIISDDHIDLNEIKVLLEDVNLVLNSANISDKQIEVLKENFQAIGESSNISEKDIETLWNDIAQIVETARNVSSL
jgi:hypothetical protein